ncbi:CLUMA_CG006935, isoform A [Clunio marinus]|uniref:Mannosyltransferase n=1 Tax=Clunio marinus TaxID=568069 RepID=A0A1J1HZ67_9DIPT|nr:CLUMA_CG006935, isoform A [Clunio marinus]
MKKVLFFLIIVRIFSVYLVQTFFSPDEYWQSLEVAHKIIYGYGHLTWEWSQGIRSYLHPRSNFNALIVKSLPETYVKVANN